MTTTVIDSRLRRAMQERKSDEFHLLIRVDQIDANHEQALQACGMTIRRSLSLTPTYAVTGVGAAGLSLLDMPWIQRVEEDGPVYAF